jgi:hypothetical protein
VPLGSFEEADSSGIFQVTMGNMFHGCTGRNTFERRLSALLVLITFERKPWDGTSDDYSP